MIKKNLKIGTRTFVGRTFIHQKPKFKMLEKKSIENFRKSIQKALSN